jgi:hypothetical protein
MRYIFLLLLIVASIGVFVALIIPKWDQVKVIQANVASYNADLAIANQLLVSRQALIAHYNDNIRLIIQLDALATKNGLSSLRNVDYNADELPTTNANGTTATPATDDTSNDAASSLLPYGQFVISFETTGQYSNFLAFLSDVEKNLRLVDVTEVTFSSPTSTTGTSATASLASGFDYKVTLTTYWLKQ